MTRPATIASGCSQLRRRRAQLRATRRRCRGATFLGVDVPNDQAVWIQPGEESNKLPYWRVYGTTLRYSVKGETRTMPVTSLISWRGEWYVVHLGAVR